MSGRRLCLSVTMLKKRAEGDQLSTRQKEDQGKIPGIKVPYVVCEKNRLLFGT